MQKISCIVIDDEPLARKGIIEYINDVDFLEFHAAFEDPVKAMTELESGKVQLIFLDIQMPKITGVEFFRSLKNAPPVVFTTAYPQYALEGFELNALDYLVKPISFERFFKAAVKARAYYELRQENRKLDAGQDFFFIKADNKLVKLRFDEILYVEALQNYVAVHTSTKKYITYLTFKSIEEYLPPGLFIKTHKSFIIAASNIDSIEGNEITIAGHKIPISRNSRDEVMEKLLKGRFLKR